MCFFSFLTQSSRNLPEKFALFFFKNGVGPFQSRAFGRNISQSLHHPALNDAEHTILEETPDCIDEDSPAHQVAAYIIRTVYLIHDRCFCFKHTVIYSTYYTWLVNSAVKPSKDHWGYTDRQTGILLRLRWYWDRNGIKIMSYIQFWGRLLSIRVSSYWSVIL